MILNKKIKNLINAKRYDIINETISGTALEINSLYDKRYIGQSCKKSIQEIISNIDNYISDRDKNDIERVKKEYGINLKQELIESIKYQGIKKFFDIKTFYIEIHVDSSLKDAPKNISKKIVKDLNDNKENKSIQYKLYRCNGDTAAIIINKI